jgi:uncharacterized membrane protein YhdT
MANQLPDNHLTLRTHKRQFAWRILIPFLVMAGLIITGAVLVVTGGASRTGNWADISVIWLLAPALFFALAILVIAITLIYGMGKLLQVLPHYTGKVQNIFTQLSAGTRKVADGTAKPFIWFRQVRAVSKSLFRH